MPPKTKKKKKQATTLARGYAITSAPSKNKEALKNEIESQVSSTISESPSTESMVSSEQTKVDKVEENINEEENYINSIIENFHDLDLKKVDAYFKDSQDSNVNEMQVLSLESNIEHKILNYIKEVGYQELDPTNNLYINDLLSQERIISSLNRLYLILLRLGFSQENIKECLRNINGAEIKVALDWLCIHLSSEDLPAGFVDKIYYEKGMNISATRSTTPTLLETSQSQVKKDVVSKTKQSSVKSTSKPLVDNNMKDWILNSLENDTTDDSELELTTTYQPLSSSTSKYAILKCELVLQNKVLSVLKKSNCSQAKREQANQRIHEIQKEMKICEEGYEINRNEAEEEFKKLIKFKDLDKEVKEILGSEIEEGEHNEKQGDKAIYKQFLQEKDQKKDMMEKRNDDDDDDDDLLGGLLDNVPEDSTASGASCGSPIIIRDMSTSKTSTARFPKDHLKEFCLNNNAKISFVADQASSIYKCSLSIQWSNKQKKEWNMGNVACRNKIEAENYVATLALFELTELPIYITFPPCYKELWLELAEEKNSAENEVKLAEEQERIKFLINIVEGKKKENVKEKPSNVSEEELIQEQNVVDKEVKSSTKQYDIVKEFSHEGEAMKKAFLNKQSSKAYMDMLEKRKRLPIYSHREKFFEVLDKNQVIIVSGETGCGKSTQIPQFITEYMLMNGYGNKCNVICAQPRRIAAISIAQRVSTEIGDLPGTIGTFKALVGYQIRLESRVSKGNILTFCTYGILLRRLESDKLLKDVSHVIIDEVHERSLESDFLIIILKKILERRNDLKIILMSATVEASKFSRYFDNSPIIEIPGRIFPVGVKFLEDVIEETDYMIEVDDEFAKKVNKQIRDEGSVTITGRGQTSHTIRLQYEEDSYDDSYIPEECFEPYSKKTRLVLSRIDETRINYDLIISLLNYICNNLEAQRKNNIPEDGAILMFLPGMAEIRRLNDQILSDRNFSDTSKFLVYPLHSTISSENQSMVFDIPPKGIRKIVLATNIAETGITIPDVTIVIDTGKVNQIRYNEKKKITNLQEVFISKANAKQRKGRAGRIREGICFHLFTKWKYEKEMCEYELPEILRLPLQELCLKIKVCEIGNINQVLSMALDAPSPKAINNAITILQEVQALTAEQELTPLGIHLSHIPVDVHLGKMILFGSIFKCLDSILTISAILNYRSPFLIPFGRESEADNVIKNKFKEGESDLLTMYKGYTLWRELYDKVIIKERGGPEGWRNIRGFCEKHFLSLQNLLMIEDIKKQFLELLVNIGFVRVDESSKNDLSRFRFQKSRSLCTVPPDYNQNSNSYAIINATILAGLYPKIIYQEPLTNKYLTIIDSGLPKNVFIHPSSITFKASNINGKKGNWFVYNTLIQTTKLYVIDVSKVEAVDLVLFGRDIEIKHEHKLLIIDKWIKLQCPGKTSSILKYLRYQLNKILKYKIDYPTKNLEKEQEDWLNLILEVINS